MAHPSFGGTIGVRVNGTSNICGSPVSIYKEFCLHGLPPGPGTASCSGVNDDNPIQGLHQHQNNTDQAGKATVPSTPTVAMSILPSLTQNSQPITVDIQGELVKDRAYQLFIYDLNGRNVFRTSELSLPGRSQINPQLKSGLYLMHFVAEGQIISSKKFVVQ